MTMGVHHPAIREALTLETYRQIRKEDERFGQEFARIYREVPEEEREAAFMEILRPHIATTRVLYDRLLAGL